VSKACRLVVERGGGQECLGNVCLFVLPFSVARGGKIGRLGKWFLVLPWEREKGSERE